MYSILKNLFLYVILFLFMLTCARQKPLGGGPKDETPPICIAKYPDVNANTNFKKNYVALTFNKAIEIRNLNKELIITPKLKKIKNKPTYTYKFKKKSIKIYFTQPLAKNTTYTVNFRNAITSTTEKKIAKQPTIIFSTGPKIDQCCIQGKVQFLMKKENVKNALVSLYRVEDEKKYTCKIFTENPDYFTYSDEEGNFELKNIKAGKYKIYAGKHFEHNLFFNAAKDYYGFQKKPINLKENMYNVCISIFKGNINPLIIQYARPTGKYFEIGFSKPINSYKINLTKKPKQFKSMPTLYSILSRDKKKITLYNTMKLIDEDKLLVKVYAEDDMGNSIEKNVDVQFKWAKQPKVRFSASTKEIKIGNTNNPFFEINFVCNKPIKTVDHKNIAIQFEKISTTIPILENEITLNEKKNIISIKKKLDTTLIQNIEKWDKKNHPFKLIIQKKAFETIEGDINSVGEKRFTLLPPNMLGTIRGNITTEFSGFIIQLLNKRYLVIQEIKNKKSYCFNNIHPGEYYIRVLALEKDKKNWYFGNVLKDIPPSPVVLYEKMLKVKANWDIKDINIFL